MKRRIAVLGSTGSIGTQTLQTVEAFPEQLEIIGLAAGHNIELLAQQVHCFHPKIVAVSEPDDAERLTLLVPQDVEVVCGPEGMIRVATLSDVDVVVAAVVGFAGLAPTMAAIEQGKDIALANKETLVAAGQLVMDAVVRHKVKLLPVDSEHSAIFQCLQGTPPQSLKQIWLTASGGPFRGCQANQLREVALDRVLHHPNWQMGRKITVDSATLMNKGLEIIEARWLFGVDYEQIKVFIHPQSIVHSMIQLTDGSVLGQMGLPDMRLPIQYALFYPQRPANQLPTLDLFDVGHLTFERPDTTTFPALEYACFAGKTGGTMPAVLNAANEVAVNLFLNAKLSFLDIAQLVREVMSRHSPRTISGIDDVLWGDAMGRDMAMELFHQLYGKASE